MPDFVAVLIKFKDCTVIVAPAVNTANVFTVAHSIEGSVIVSYNIHYLQGAASVTDGLLPLDITRFVVFNKNCIWYGIAKASKFLELTVLGVCNVCGNVVAVLICFNT